MQCICRQSDARIHRNLNPSDQRIRVVTLPKPGWKSRNKDCKTKTEFIPLNASSRHKQIVFRQLLQVALHTMHSSLTTDRSTVLVTLQQSTIRNKPFTNTKRRWERNAVGQDVQQRNLSVEIRVWRADSEVHLHCNNRHKHTHTHCSLYK